MSGTIWQTHLQTSQVSGPLYINALNNEGASIENVLDCDSIITDIRHDHADLLNYLCKSETINSLITFLTQDPPKNADERRGYRYPLMANELICSRNNNFLKAILDDENNLTYFWKFIQSPPPLNPVLCGYFYRCWSNFLSFDYDKVYKFITSQPKFCEHMLNHLYSRSIAELVEMILCLNRDEKPLKEENLALTLVRQLNPLWSKCDYVLGERHDNLLMIIRSLFRRQTSNTLIMYDMNATQPKKMPWFEGFVEDIVSKECMVYLMEFLFCDCKYTISAVISVLTEILNGTCIGHPLTKSLIQSSYLIDGIENQNPSDDIPANSEFTEQNFNVASGNEKETSDKLLEKFKNIENGHFISVYICPQIRRLKPILLSALKHGSARQAGIKHVNYTTLEVLWLIRALLRTNCAVEVMNELLRIKFINILVKFLFRYRWNSLYHSCISEIFESFLSDLKELQMGLHHLITQTKFLEKTFQHLKNVQLMRLCPSRRYRNFLKTKYQTGYTGYLLRLCQGIEHYSKEFSWVEDILSQYPDWKGIVEVECQHFQEMTNLLLGGHAPPSQAAQLVSEVVRQQNVPVVIMGKAT